MGADQPDAPNDRRGRHMGMPSGIGIIDTMMGTRAGATAKTQNYAFLRQGQLKDAESKDMNFPAQYMFMTPFSTRRGAEGPVEEPVQGADLPCPDGQAGVEKARSAYRPRTRSPRRR
jgi:hypothetical protein